MAKNSLSSLWSSIIKEAPNYAAKYAPKIKEAGLTGVEYIQVLFEINTLKGKNAKEDLTIDSYYHKLGKTFYEQKLTSSNETIKGILSKINNCNAEKEKNKLKIKKLEAKLKSSASSKPKKSPAKTKAKTKTTKKK